jgi:hypothetical protein
MPDLSPFDVDLEGDVAGSYSGRPWRETPPLDSEGRSQMDRAYGESGVALAPRRHPHKTNEVPPGRFVTGGQHMSVACRGFLTLSRDLERMVRLG